MTLREKFAVSLMMGTLFAITIVTPDPNSASRIVMGALYLIAYILFLVDAPTE